MEFDKLVHVRHSSRDFSDRPVSAATLTAIVMDAKQAPSWANAQPWQVIIATGQTLATIKQQHRLRSRQGLPGNADLTVAHRTEWSDTARQNMAIWNSELGQFLQQTVAGPAGYGRTQDNLFNAAALVYLVLPRPINQWAVFDLGAFAQTLMLSAANRGVQSIPAYEIVRYPDNLRSLLQVDDDQRFVMGIALGYENDNPINKFGSSRASNQQFLTLKD
ncbi:nitroreductase [Levilactobacillus enshiensis]|uniref:nitroreductase n=1 Tax=Levilactobacillus enshiensis TaxID=2590213 RepID=UPI00117ABB4D|nr:nitroreductase [Levilactobacillus enshiensis]